MVAAIASPVGRLPRCFISLISCLFLSISSCLFINSWNHKGISFPLSFISFINIFFSSEVISYIFLFFIHSGKVLSEILNQNHPNVFPIVLSPKNSFCSVSSFLFFFSFSEIFLLKNSVTIRPVGVFS